MRLTFRVAATAVAILAVSGCAGGSETQASSTGSVSLALTSSDFSEGDSLPASSEGAGLGGQCNGPNTSPTLAWSGAPDGTVSYVLTFTDPDASGFVHGFTVDIAEEVQGAAEGAWDALGVNGTNNAGLLGYFGPCPPSGTHAYTFTLYALDADLNLNEGFDPDAARAAMAGHILGTATLTGTYAAAG